MATLIGIFMGAFGIGAQPGSGTPANGIIDNTAGSFIVDNVGGTYIVGNV